MKKQVSLLIVLCLINFLSAEWGNQIYTEGNEILYNNEVKSVFFYDTRDDLDGGAWRTDSSKSWFNEPSNPSDDFLGMDIDDNRWNISDSNNYLSQDNKINCYKDSTGDHDQFHSAEYASNWNISGDFDIQIDFDLITWEPSIFQRESSVRLEFWVNDNNKCKLWRYRHSDDNYWGQIWRNGAEYSGREPSGVGNEWNGKLRLTRNGNFLAMWRWDTASNTWQRVFHRTDFSNQSGQIKIVFTNYNTEMELNVDNFIVNSGNVNFSNNGSATRSEIKEFPEQAALIRTAESLEIVDIANNECWMRFTGINDNLGAIAGTSDCVYAKNGVIYTTWDGDYKGMIKLDFINDHIYYLSQSYNQLYDGDITKRNFDQAWENITPTLNLGTDNINQIYGTNLNDNEYIGVASQNGAHVIINQEIINHSSNTSNLNNIYFDGDSNLICNSIYSMISFSRNYLYPNFSISNTLAISYTQAITASEGFIFAATINGVRKLVRDTFVDTGISYTNSLGLDPTSSNNCTGIVVFGDTLFVGTTGSNGKISALDFTSDNYLFTVPEAIYVSQYGNSLAGGETPEYNRNLIWGTTSGVNRFFGSSGNLSPLNIQIVNGNAVLNWHKVIPATIYRIYRSTSSEFETIPENYHNSSTENEFIDYNISSDMKLFYKVTWE
ncbi:MAG: hypothetical protein K8S23_03300 [Candidatus Cloacimonetes bacterium]|nr:hypothetical protein [Candidatus Cloacimonadota bacterium]